MRDLLLAYYGDDFSGSADALEVLAAAGVPTVLFLQTPTAAKLARFPGLRAVGVAGLSRSLPTAMLEAELRPVFAALAQLSPLLHYKICSTFDSSPQVGSIGKVIDLAREMFKPCQVPLVVGAPALGRYCAFGNLFARSGTDGMVYRLDRHPTMARHPATPMDEADLRILLARQTKACIASLDWLHLREEHCNRLGAEAGDIIVLDTLTDDQLPIIGRLILESVHAERTFFTVGSTGVEYALTAYWREIGQISDVPTVARFASAEPVVVVSGSCSPVTEVQIAHAVQCGFAQVGLQPEDWTRGDAASIVAQTRSFLKEGRNVIVHAAAGPNDPRIARARALLDAAGRPERRDAVLGGVLASVLKVAVQEAGVTRIGIAGGDTSGHVMSRLGVEALQYVAPLAPGSPLCRISSSSSLMNGVEVTFKGGQVGAVDFFVRLARGTREPFSVGNFRDDGEPGA
jgi:3-oxoisoapionate kinase